MKTIVIASNNAHKAEEIATALAFPGWEFRTLRQLGLDSDPAEDADTFEGNARIKAQAARAASGGLAVLADDSGLAVDALDGAPGVHSARYAGEPCDDAANNAKLLAELADVPDEKRTGRFVCTLVFIDEDGAEALILGCTLTHRPRGARRSRLRVRPAIPSRRVRRRPHPGRGFARGEERRVPSRQRPP